MTSIQISKSCVRILFDHYNPCVTISSFLRRLGPQSHETLDLASCGIPLSSPIDCFTIDPICQLLKPVMVIDRASFFLKFAFLKYTNAGFRPQTLFFLMLSLTFDVSFGSQQPRARRNISPPPGTSTTFTERDLLNACTCSVSFIFVNLPFSS